MGHSIKRRATLLAFVAPALIMYGMFTVYPYVSGIQKSFTDWTGLSAVFQYVGFDNFAAMLKDPIFVRSVYNSLLLTMGTMIPTLGLALLFAIRFNRPGFVATLLRSCVIIPTLLSPAAAAAVGKQLFHPEYGALNAFLVAIGLESLTKPWVAVSWAALPAVGFIWTWFSVGFYVLIFYAALQSVSPELVDAANVDGANAWQVFRHITLPAIWGVLQVTVIFYICGSFVYSFTLVTLMTRGGPSHASEVMPSWLITKAFLYSRFGYATAIGVAVFLLTAVLVAIALFGLRRKAFE